MLCPDGAGCYSFAFDRASRKAAIERLERVRDRLDEGARHRKELSPDATALLDMLANVAGVTATPELIVRAAAELDADLPKTIGKPASGPELAARLGWTYDRVQLAAVELAELGYLETHQGGPLS